MYPSLLVTVYLLYPAGIPPSACYPVKCCYRAKYTMQGMVDLRKPFVHKRRKIMKRFTILLAILGVLVFSAFFQAWSESRAEAKKASIAPVYDSTGAMLKAIHPKSSNVSISPVYDATGAMLEAINTKEEQKALPLVYDATDAMWDAINSKSTGVRIAPVYDATGAMLEAIN